MTSIELMALTNDGSVARKVRGSEGFMCAGSSGGAGS